MGILIRSLWMPGFIYFRYLLPLIDRNLFKDLNPLSASVALI